MRYANLDTGETGDFLQIRAAGMPLLAPLAEGVKQSYDVFLREQYAALLANQQSEIRQLLGAAGVSPLFRVRNARRVRRAPPTVRGGFKMEQRNDQAETLRRRMVGGLFRSDP